MFESARNAIVIYRLKTISGGCFALRAASGYNKNIFTLARWQDDSNVRSGGLP